MSDIAPTEFEPLPTGSDLCEAAVLWASELVGETVKVDLHVSRSLMDLGTATQIKLGLPIVSRVFVDETLGPYDWYIQANGRRMGSRCT